MRTYSTSRIVQRFYHERYGVGSGNALVTTWNRRPWLRQIGSQLQLMAYGMRGKWPRVILIFTVCVVGASTVYYYNMLVMAQQDMLACMGNVEALMQRRSDLSTNLSKAVLDYSKHEKGVFTGVVGIRSRVPGGQSEKQPEDAPLNRLMAKVGPPASVSPGGQSPAAPSTNGPEDPFLSLANLLAVAEQYPDLKLSANFQTLMTAVVDVEKDLATERMKYNQLANNYTTTAAMFPAKVFAKIFSFRMVPYFTATEEASRFKPIEY